MRLIASCMFVAGVRQRFLISASDKQLDVGAMHALAGALELGLSGAKPVVAQINLWSARTRQTATVNRGPEQAAGSSAVSSWIAPASGTG